jgi:hypothetical protein
VRKALTTLSLRVAERKRAIQDSGYRKGREQTNTCQLLLHKLKNDQGQF